MNIGLDLTKNYFKYNFDKPSSYAFHAVALNYFVKEVLSKRNDKKSTQLFFRLFRVGLIGDILYKAGGKHIKNNEHDVNHEILAALFEGYLVLARSVYDYLLVFLKEQYGVEELSFNKFLKQVKKEKYKGFNSKFKTHLNSKLFTDIISLRDSVTHKTPNLMVYVKNGKYRIDGTIYRDDGTRENFDESIHTLIFGYTTSLLLLMSYIAEGATGKSLAEQIRAQDLQDGKAPSNVSQ
ncbi:MAG: hypothetical protein Q7R69_02180 [bacterium]|nr:hypothetical protein [bacterium]